VKIPIDLVTARSSSPIPEDITSKLHEPIVSAIGDGNPVARRRAALKIVRPPEARRAQPNPIAA